VKQDLGKEIPSFWVKLRNYRMVERTIDSGSRD
jgi:hypothetical protein